MSETVTLVMTDKGMNSLLATSVKLGGDASIAAGPIGAGANSDITTDFVAFSRSKGVYGGLNLEGSVIDVADDWNRTYYGTAVLPPDILMRARCTTRRRTAWRPRSTARVPAKRSASHNSGTRVPGRVEAVKLRPGLFVSAPSKK